MLSGRLTHKLRGVVANTIELSMRRSMLNSSVPTVELNTFILIQASADADFYGFLSNAPIFLRQIVGY